LFEPFRAITTISLFSGRTLPDQVVVVADATPVDELVIVAAFTLIDAVINRAANTITVIAFLFLITFEWNRLFLEQKDFSKILRASGPQKKYRNQ
jgi:hypothetical protein